MEGEIDIILREKKYLFKLRTEQLSIMENILKGHDTLAVLPTGYGKSMCYVVPPLLLDKKFPNDNHMSLVISPLLSLIEDNVINLREHGIRSCGITSEITAGEVQDIKSGNVSVILSTPEAILTRRWRAILDEVQSKICMVAYDEAHCISEWGLDFREDYTKVGIIQSILDAPVLVISATITKDIKMDIDRVLGLKEDTKVIANLPDRQNIFLCIFGATEKYEEELSWVKKEVENCGVMCKKLLIYVTSISACEKLYIWLHSSLKHKVYNGNVSIDTRLVEMYHSNTDQQSKDRIMGYFRSKDSPIRVLIATVACGMGLDIPDITAVLLWGLPPSILQMWQEIGRCGRDGRQSLAICYAYPRSVSMPCDKCRKKGNHVCSCPQRFAMRNIVSNKECQRVECLKSFLIEGMESVQMDKIRAKITCSKECAHSCQCDACLCCVVCWENCLCEKKMQTKIDIISHYMAQ